MRVESWFTFLDTSTRIFMHSISGSWLAASEKLLIGGDNIPSKVWVRKAMLKLPCWKAKQATLLQEAVYLLPCQTNFQLTKFDTFLMFAVHFGVVSVTQVGWLRVRDLWPQPRGPDDSTQPGHTISAALSTEYNFLFCSICTWSRHWCSGQHISLPSWGVGFDSRVSYGLYLLCCLLDSETSWV